LPNACGQPNLVSNPEFILLRKAQELKKRLGNSEEIEELVNMTEGIIDQNIKVALLDIMTAMDQTELKDGDILKEMFTKIVERRSQNE
jgi:hypothetical protein